MKKQKYSKGQVIVSLVILLAIIVAWFVSNSRKTDNNSVKNNSSSSVTYSSLKDIPDYSGTPFVTINGNVPEFDSSFLKSESFENYSELDSLGRCGEAFACIGTDIMPTQPRESISSVKPSGWKSVKYDFVDGKSLYNRCHLIGFQLAGENANKKNLITGTRYLNVQGMLPFENMVCDYIKETENHVLYRVTPVFKDDELVARGVIMDGYSVEDAGDGICFSVYIYNVQPGVTINYATGDSKADKQSSEKSQTAYILNSNSKKFHKPDCKLVDDIKPENRENFNGDRDILTAQGYVPCKSCNP